ncbi:MAG TPA: ribosome biogenesis factor YjgA [Arenimonas sp.]|uniref:ribosome biogenesis factor YjgA n=1 Tax=Arenimonas sp. TaxID=1872635 RepID=UPI002B621E51|nr:ribosome biogenesis factor YjgA [Arenimonas sp.]HMB55836.1 ribosome biogenesis factor YjgA [Arenimonas sp.]
MRGVDEESGEFLGRSRGDQRREALAVLDLAELLVKQPHARLLQLPLNDDLVALVVEAQRITAQIAHKRQVGFLAKKLRREDDEYLEAIRSALEHDKADSRRENASLHRLEALRDHLIAQGDEALAEVLQEFPHADRQHLRQLARNAREEKLRNKPPHAFRELFRALRELQQEAPEDE